MTNLEMRTTTDVGAVEVRLRHVDATEGVALGKFDVSKLDWLIRELGRWGVNDEDGATTSNVGGVFSGTFRLDSDAYFEIVLEPESNG